MTKRFDVLVVGAGFTGAVIAERLASELGRRVLVVDRRPYFGGNAHDRLDPNGVLIHDHGPHVFHTNAPRIVEYLSRFTAWRPYEHRVRAWIEGDFIPLPVNLDAIETLFGPREGGRLGRVLLEAFGPESKVPILRMRESASADVRRVADRIYEKVFLHYTVKQWGVRPDQIDAAVSARVPVRLSRDDRFFLDTFQAMPADGYTAMFARMLDHPLIEVRTGVDHRAVVDSERFDRLVFTGPIDAFFDHCHGPLPYRSVRHVFESVAAEEPVQPVGQLNYPTPAGEHPWTRVAEFRHLTGQAGIGVTTLAYEHPEPHVHGVNEPGYPVPAESSRELLRRYQAEADRLSTVTFAGRLGDYAYYDMDQAVGRALACFGHLARD